MPPRVPVPFEVCAVDEGMAPDLQELLQRRLAGLVDESGAQLPYVAWKRFSGGRLLITVLCEAHEPGAFFNELRDRLAERLTTRAELNFSSSFCVPLRIPSLSNQTLLFAELQLPISQERDLKSLEEGIRQFEADIAGLGARRSQRYVTAGLRRRWMHRRINRVIQQFPDELGDRFHGEIHTFMKLTASDFRAVRPLQTLMRIFFSLYALKAAISRETASLPKVRSLHLRLLMSDLCFPFGSKRVLGVAAALRLEDSRERLGKEHLVRAIGRVFSGVRVVPGSYVSYEVAGSKTVLLYIEVEELDGAPPERKKYRRLSQPLIEELLQSVERRVSSVLIHKNEADIERHIQTLGRELQKKQDLPQVIIEFHKQERTSLTFTVILARMVGESSLPLERLLVGLPDEIEVIFDSQKLIDRLEGGLCKEASVFGIRLAKERFLRRDRSIDLHKARQCVAGQLSEALGEMRDFNGGLILKQNEVLVAVRSTLTPEERGQEELLDSLFYALVPRVVQSYIEPELVQDCFRMVLRVLKTPHQGHQSCLIEVSPLPSALVIVVEGKESSFRREVLQAIERINLDSLRLAYSSVDAQERSLLCILFRSDDETLRQRLIEAVQGSLREWRQGLRQQQRLRISLPLEISALDPRIHTQRRHGVLLKMFFEGLMRLDGQGRPALALAEHVNISRDRCTYTFELRESFWTNGQPVTARDFVYAWKRAASPKHNGFHKYLFFPIKNFAAIQRGGMDSEALSVRAEGDRRLVVQLEHPAPYFLDLTAHWCYSPVCEGIDERCPDWAYHERNAYVCNGPFRPGKSNGQWRLRAIRNCGYWDADAVKLEEIDISVVQDPKTTWRLYRHKLLDWIGEPLSEVPLEVMRGEEGRRVLQKGNLGAIHWYELNVEAVPFTSKKVRRACALAINRERLVQEVLNGTVDPALGFLPTEAALATDPQLLRGDKFQARRLFEEGLQEIGCDLQELPPIVLKHGLFEEHCAIAAFVAEEWKQTFGIRVEMEYVPRFSYAEHITSLNFQVAAVTWYAWYRDPSYNLMHLCRRSWFLNCTQWEHPEYVRLLDAANNCLDLGERLLLLRQAEELLFEEMPIVPICGQKHAYIKRDGLRNVVVTDLGQIDFKGAYIQEEERLFDSSQKPQESE